jgi:hypothetical protein
MKFELVNPYIVGSFNTTYEADTAIKAAEKFWKALTEENKHVTNNVPQFLFTLKGGDKLSHFIVHEKASVSKDKNIEFSINEVAPKISSKRLETFNKNLEKFKKECKDINSQSGGRHHHHKDDKGKDDDSSSSSSDYNYVRDYVMFRNVESPILYWWYYPTLYTTVYDSVFVPTFNYSYVPYVQIRL